MKVSVIIPTLNESLLIEHTLREINRHSPHEVIVADGGSSDNTLEISRAQASKVVSGPPGRARQMNNGAAFATGDLLLFLHADSRVDAASFSKMVEVMTRGDKVGGAFSLTIDSKKFSLRIIAVLATLRSRFLGLVYGDQAIFVRADVFRKMDGFSSLPICEDLDLFKRLEKTGSTVLLEEKAITSPRRWLGEGIVFTTLRNGVIATLFLLGFPPRILSRWYLAIR